MYYIAYKDQDGFTHEDVASDEELVQITSNQSSNDVLERAVMSAATTKRFAVMLDQCRWFAWVFAKGVLGISKDSMEHAKEKLTASEVVFAITQQQPCFM